MRARTVCAGVGVAVTVAMHAFAFYPDTNIRCRMYGINANDCINSVYRPGMPYDIYAKSFSVPVRKEAICAYVPCKMAMIGSGTERYLSIAKHAHPPGDCLCIGIAQCGCEAMEPGISVDDTKTVYTMPTHEQQNVIPHIVTKTVHAIETVKVTEIPEVVTKTHIKEISAQQTPSSAHENMQRDWINTIINHFTSRIQEKNKKHTHKHSDDHKNEKNISTGIQDTMGAPSEHSTQKEEYTGRVITIPYSTVVSTVKVTVPTYSTLTRTQYVVNTVDNYITKTTMQTKTKTQTETKTQTKSVTVTETVSDHVERTKFSTIYMPKTVTVDKIVTVTATDTRTDTQTRTKTRTKTVTVSVTATKTRIQHKEAKKTAQAGTVYAQPMRSPYIIVPPTAMQQSAQHNVIGSAQTTSHSRQKLDKISAQYIGQKRAQRYVVVKRTHGRLICPVVNTEYIDAKKAMTGQCEIGSAHISQECIPAPQQKTEVQSRECVGECEKHAQVKTVYVRVAPTQVIHK